MSDADNIPSRRRNGQAPNVLLDEPALGHFQFVVLCYLLASPVPVCGRDIIDALRAEAPPLLSDAQVYLAIRKLTERGLAVAAGTAKVPGAPSLKLYRASPEGREVAVAIKRHHEALVAFASAKHI